MPGNHHRGGLLVDRDGVAQQLWSGRMDRAVTLQGHGEVGAAQKMPRRRSQSISSRIVIKA
jgi:hypothetical protein